MEIYDGRLVVKYRGYKIRDWLKNITVPVIWIMAAMINPYGIDGTLYIFRGIGIADKFDIMELNMPGFLSAAGIYILMLVILTIIFIRTMETRDILMCMGLCIFGMFASRNMNFLPLAFLPLTACISRDNESFRFMRLPGFMLGIIAGICLLASFTDQICTPISYDMGYGPDGYYEDLDGLLGYIDEKDSRILCGFTDGNYLEFKGHKVFWDARPELYAESINGTKDYYKDYIDLYKSPCERTGIIIEGYGFDYIITDIYSKLYGYMTEMSGYDKITVNGNKVLWHKQKQEEGLK